MKIKKIEKINDYNKTVYNLHVKNNHNYIANNIVVSNCHTAKAKNLYELLSDMDETYYKYGFTGTMPKQKLDYKKVESVIGKKHHIISTKKLIEKGHGCKVNVKLVYFKYPGLELEKIHSWPEENSFIRANQNREVFIRKTVLAKIRLGMNNVVFFSDVKHKSGEKLYNFLKANGVEHVYLIDSLTKSKDRDEVRSIMENNVGVTIITTYQLFGTGTNIKNLHNVFFTQPIGTSNIRILQTIGRGIRLHISKDSVDIFDFVDYLNYSIRHSLDRIRIYDKEGFEKKIITVNL